MERNVHERNQLREISLRITNQLLVAESEPNTFGLYVQYCDTRFFENKWGLELFKQPLLSVYFSDEDFPDEPLPTGTILDNHMNTDYGSGYDDHLTLYASSSPLIFGAIKGSGDFGDHETTSGIVVYRAPYQDISDNDVDEALTKSLSEGKNAIDPDKKRPLRLFAANINSGAVVYNKPLMLDKHDNDIEAFLSMPLFGSNLVNIALTGKYFLYLGRPERIGAFMEQRERFDIKAEQDLTNR